MTVILTRATFAVKRTRAYDEPRQRRALSAGAVGYIPKHSSERELLTAIRTLRRQHTLKLNLESRAELVVLALATGIVGTD